MTELVEKLHASGFIISESDGHLSRENGVLASGQNLGAGTVLGRLVTAGTITAAAAAGNTGTGTMGSMTVGGGAKVGDYKVIIIEPAANAGVFEVIDPNGVLIGRGNVAVAFAGDVNFTLSDATDFISGDMFTLTVSGLTVKYKILAPAATDGTQAAAGVLVDAVDATSADTACALVARLAELNSNEIIWPAAITAAQQSVATAQLASRNIALR